MLKWGPPCWARGFWSSCFRSRGSVTSHRTDILANVRRHTIRRAASFFVVAELVALGARLTKILDMPGLSRTELQTVPLMRVAYYSYLGCLLSLYFYKHLCHLSASSHSYAHSVLFKEMCDFYCRAWLQAISPNFIFYFFGGGIFPFAALHYLRWLSGEMINEHIHQHAQTLLLYSSSYYLCRHIRPCDIVIYH